MKHPSEIPTSQYPKLVRDYMPLIISREGATPVFRYISGEEKRSALVDKLREESAELFAALESGNLEEIAAEIADVQEVLKAIAQTNGIQMSMIADHQMQKAAVKGTFSRGVYMEAVELNE